MKKKCSSLLLAACLGGLHPVSAQLTIPSDGSDGALNITENTVIDLTQAADGSWDSLGSGHGVYDSDQWAVVFKYSSVNIAGGTTVTFTNHRTYAPVVWLVHGNITIDGTLNLSGQGGSSGEQVTALTPTEPGPGGYRGAAGAVNSPNGPGSGYGPAGGPPSWDGRFSGIYGNLQIIPLIGGSGAGTGWGSGGAGGGAILIAASGTVSIGGSILANGGSYYHYGSGGAVRIIASEVTGGGTISATGNGPNTPQDGRIRIEANVLASSLTTTPATGRATPADPPVIWPAANAPKVRVVSVDAVNAPSDPTAPLVANADMLIQNNSSVNIILETKDFPIEGVVQLYVVPKFGERTTLNATRLDGSITQATWKVTTTLPTGFVVLQPRVTQP